MEFLRSRATKRAEQKQFCDILFTMKHPNRTKAYRLAGYKGTGHTAEVNAGRLLKNAEVSAYLEFLRSRTTERAEQKRFCDILFTMKNPNQMEAYRLAGYKGSGHTAEANASKILKKAEVSAYMEFLRSRATERAEKKADEIVKELENLGPDFSESLTKRKEHLPGSLQNPKKT